MPNDVTDRLRLLRPLVGVDLRTEREMAAFLGLSPPRWSNYLCGANDLPVEVAIEIVRVIPGLDLDWIYRGDEAGLSVRMYQRLQKLRERVAAQA